jgi:hypothetical protein
VVGFLTTTTSTARARATAAAVCTEAVVVDAAAADA